MYLSGFDSHDQVPTTSRQEVYIIGVSSLSFAGRSLECGCSEPLPPDMDLSCLPIVPPVLPAWASAEDTFAKAKCDRTSKAIPIDACRFILAPKTSGGIVLVE